VGATEDAAGAPEPVEGVMAADDVGVAAEDTASTRELIATFSLDRDAGGGALMSRVTGTTTGVCMAVGAVFAEAAAAGGVELSAGGSAPSAGVPWCAAAGADGGGLKRSEGRRPSSVIVSKATAATAVTAARIIVALARDPCAPTAVATEGATEVPYCTFCGIALGGGTNGDGGG
jgi:hypothetical protein